MTNPWRLTSIFVGALVLAACQGGPTPESTGVPGVPTAPSGPGTLWSDPATWGGKVPGPGSAVTIPAGKTITLDASAEVRSITVMGNLVWGERDNLELKTGWLMVHGPGSFKIGSAAKPFTQRATLTLTGNNPAEDVMGMGTKFIGTMMGGRVELFGAPVKGWTKLNAEAAAGARQITLAEATGWKAGDQIVIATSSPNMDEYDLAEIESVSGAAVTLRQPLKFKHFGQKRQVAPDISVDVRAEVGLLSRNVVIRGDAGSQASRFGGHAMFMAESPTPAVQISGVEFRDMGQFNRLGRYPVHFHLMGTNCTGCFLRDSTIRDSVQRGVVIHDSAVAVRGNVIFNTVGHNLVVETPQTVGATIEGNLALVNRQPNPLFTEATLRTQEDRLPANFWMRSGANTVTGNAAAGSFSNGFIYDGIDARPITFRGNTVHAAMSKVVLGEGDFDLMAGLMIASGANRPSNDEIVDTLAYHNASGIWPEESETPIKIGRFIVAENAIGVQNRGVGNQVVLNDGIFIQTLPGSGHFSQGLASHNQYGSDVLMVNPTFVNYKGIGLDGTDTGPTQSSFELSNPRIIGGNPAFNLTDLSLTVFSDDKVVPRGSYFAAVAPWLGGPGCALAPGAPSTADLPMTRCPTRYKYGELDIRDGANLAQRINQTAYLLRSDGLRYRMTGGDAGVGSGVHATTVNYSAGLSFALETPSAKGYALRLMADPAPEDGTVFPETALLDVAVPVNAAPSAVHRTGRGFNTPDAPSASTALRAASSLADWNANPLTSYFYDAAARKVWVKASARWVIVVP